MKNINLSLCKNQEFYQNADTPFTVGDVSAYKLCVQATEDLSGGRLVVKAKRKDGISIVDSAVFVGSYAEYVLKNNMYEVPDEVELEIQVVYNSTVWTTCCLTAAVRTGAGEPETQGDDRIPVLSSLILDARGAADFANEKGNYAKGVADLMTPFFVSDEPPQSLSSRYIWFDTGAMTQNVLLNTTAQSTLGEFSLKVGTGQETITNAVGNYSEEDPGDITITAI